MRSIAQGKTTNVDIAKRFDCSVGTVNRLFELYRVNNMGAGANTKVGMSSRSEPYQTEEQMLSSPFYNARNRERITPIRSDWKLY